MEFLFRDYFKEIFVFIVVYFVLDYEIGVQ